MATIDDRRAVTWARVDKDFFVASTADAFIGTIDAAAEEFSAHDALSRPIGVFSSLDAAMAAVVEHHDSLQAS